MNLTVNFIRDFLVIQLGCNETPLQPENEPSEEALLYAIDDCDGNPVDEICTTSGILEVNEANFLIYPNPSIGNITVDASYEFDKIRIFNIQGQVLKTQEVSSNGMTLDLSMFENGSYLIQLESMNGTLSKTLKFQLIK